MRPYCLAFGLTVLTLVAHAQPVAGPLKSNDAYVSEPTRTVNAAIFQSHQLIKKSLKGESFTIPKDWRLVSVVPDNAKSAAGTEFVLFFQDAQSAVHSVGIQANGALSGHNLITIPAKD
jgi:hypothetical protein